MDLSRTNLIILAAAGSAAMLIGAWGFQFIGGLPPCPMCLWQRYPHAATVLIGFAALMLPGRILPLLGATAALTTAAIGVYHAGVEKGLFEGPSTCTSTGVGDLSVDQLMAQIMSAPVIRCDEVLWEFLGVSMAGWNAIASAGFAGLWLLAAWKAR